MLDVNRSAILLDRQPLWLEAVERVLDRIDVNVVGKATAPKPALELIQRHRPDVFKELHFRFSGEDANGRRISGVAWKMADRLPPVGPPLELAVQLNWNHYNGRRTLQMELLDWRLAGT